MAKRRALYDARLSEVYASRKSYALGSTEDALALFEKCGVPKIGIVLDIGSNVGDFLVASVRRGWSNSMGVEVSDSALSVARRLHPHIAERCRLYDGRVLPFDNGICDAITMFNVLEHIPDVEVFLRDQVLRVLKPGGMFIFQTPNKWVDVVYESLKFRSLTRWKPFHCSLQTPLSMKAMLVRCGFANVVVERVRLSGSVYYQNVANRVLGRVLGKTCVRLFDVLPGALAPVICGKACKSI